MDFIDQLRSLSTRIAATKDIIKTEEATKNAMVMPFIQILGYNVFDPLEVTPELVADVGTKKGEKVDYAVLQDGKPIMLFECKKAGADLCINHAGQLFRYFHVTAASFGVLTNGLVYKFFTDLEQPNKMDETPFFDFNVLDFKERDVEELKKFAKSAFDIDAILHTANDLKFTTAIQSKLAGWMAAPEEKFVRLLAADLVGTRKFTQTVIDQFTAITKRAFEQMLSERINDRLKGAMQTELPPAELPEGDADSLIVTTAEEVEGFHIVRAILRGVVGPQRICLRDSQSYCAILLDDNNRKPICRLVFNNTKRLALVLFHDKKDGDKVALESVDGIYAYAEQIKATVLAYPPLPEAKSVPVFNSQS
jgi:hypothetical protein